VTGETTDAGVGEGFVPLPGYEAEYDRRRAATPDADDAIDRLRRTAMDSEAVAMIDAALSAAATRAADDRAKRIAQAVRDLPRGCLLRSDVLRIARTTP